MRLPLALLLLAVSATAAFADPPDLPDPISPQVGAVQITDQPSNVGPSVLQLLKNLPYQIERIELQRTVPEPRAQQFVPVPPLPQPLRIQMQPLPVRRTVQVLPTLQNLFQARPISAAIQESKETNKRQMRILVDHVNRLENIRITDTCEDGKQISGLEFRTKTILLKNIAAKTALDKVNQLVFGKTTPKPQGTYTGQIKLEVSFRRNEPPKSPSPTLIVDSRGNALHIIATPKQLAAIEKCVKELDRAPKQYVFEIKIRELIDGKPGAIISAPQIVTTAGQKAKVQIGGPTGSIEIEAIVKTNQSAPPMPINVDTIGRTRVLPHPQPQKQVIRPASAWKEIEQKANPNDVDEAPGPQSEPKPQADKNTLTVRVYSIADRIITPPAPGEKLKQDEAGYRKNAESLINVITTTVQPNSWREVGGDCSIEYFATSYALVVRQTESGHKQIEKLLESLRNIDKQNDKKKQ